MNAKKRANKESPKSITTISSVSLVGNLRVKAPYKTKGSFAKSTICLAISKNIGTIL
jgi:hypothetical protein